MPQPTRPTSVKIVQYWPFRQRLLMPIAQPFLNCSAREMVRGNGSGMMRSSRRAGGRQPPVVFFKQGADAPRSPVSVTKKHRKSEATEGRVMHQLIATVVAL